MFGILTSEAEHRRVRRGTTITELMVTMLILAFVVAALMPFVVSIMKIREDERESSYVRERLADISSILADFISMGNSFAASDDIVDFRFRPETGGVSLETGTVTHVTYFRTSSESSGGKLDIGAFQTEFGVPSEAYSRCFRGRDVSFSTFTNEIRCVFTPFAQSALGELQLTQRYRLTEESPWRTVSVRRMVRLWNAEAEK